MSSLQLFFIVKIANTKPALYDKNLFISTVLLKSVEKIYIAIQAQPTHSSAKPVRHSGSANNTIINFILLE